MNRRCAEIPVGSEGVLMLPFGNGAERMLGNRYTGAEAIGLDLNRHDRFHLAPRRAGGDSFCVPLRDGRHAGDRVAAPGDPGQVCESVPQSRVPADVGYPVRRRHRIVQYRRGFGRRPGRALGAGLYASRKRRSRRSARSTKCVPILRTGMCWNGDTALESRTGKPARPRVARNFSLKFIFKNNTKSNQTMMESMFSKFGKIGYEGPDSKNRWRFAGTTRTGSWRARP